MPGVWVPSCPGGEYATVRISKIILDDFKSVRHGEIVLNCGKQFVKAGTEPDILGLYGQNGSGKSTVIEALSILQSLLSGDSVPDEYADCIAVDAEFAHMYFEFDFQYPDERKLRVSYAASISKEPKPRENSRTVGEFSDPDFGYRIRVFDEMVKIEGLVDGEERQFRSCIDTLSSSAKPFGPASRHSDFYEVNTANKKALSTNLILAAERSKSFIFMDETMDIFYQEGKNASQVFLVLAELNLFAKRYFFVIDASFSASYSDDFYLPFFTRRGVIPFSLRESLPVPLSFIPELEKALESTNGVLEELVPGLSIDKRQVGSVFTKDGHDAVSLDFISCRDGLEFPLRNESDGIRKLISVINLFIAAFNEKSVTVAIDEFDAGIFEYLLGEMLQIFEDSGRGQFIFTSHNLRPLEVLSKKYIRFTTTNPDNRYYSMKGVATNNNLRDFYFREIVMGEQDEELYSSGKRFKLVSSLRRADF